MTCPQCEQEIKTPCFLEVINLINPMYEGFFQYCSEECIVRKVESFRNRELSPMFQELFITVGRMEVIGFFQKGNSKEYVLTVNFDAG